MVDLVFAFPSEGAGDRHIGLIVGSGRDDIADSLNEDMFLKNLVTDFDLGIGNLSVSD